MRGHIAYDRFGMCPGSSSHYYFQAMIDVKEKTCLVSQPLS